MVTAKLATLGAVFLMLAPATPGSAQTQSPRPAYLQRGDEVEARYRGYRERLERDFQMVGARLQAEAPDLYPRLKAAMPGPIPYGYQILPKLVADAAPSKGPPRPIFTAFSWRQTDALIEAGLREIDDLETKVHAVSGMAQERRRKEWVKLVDRYVALARRHRLISNQIQYHRLWQNEIALRGVVYDYLTTLHDAVLERQAILDAIDAGDQDPSFWEREQALLRQIRRHTDVLRVPDFLRIERPDPRRWVVRVPVHTDIDDPSLVQAIKSAVETAWHVKDGEDQFQITLDVRYVTASQLYQDGKLPARGDHIDLAKHIGRFPGSGAVLTTGANSLHVLGRSINLGPHDVAPNVLAHEFGHILGFMDGYFRGYRDRGPEGYEVLEVVIDPEDIMSAPGVGRVHRRHFERLLATIGSSPR